LEIRHKDIMS